MKRLSLFVTVIIGVGLSLRAPLSLADSIILFPLPLGKHRVTSGYEDHHQRLNTAHKSLDFQVAEIPESVLGELTQEIREKGARCYSYGAPVLAARPGKVIYLEDWVEKYRDKSYGNYVKIEHEDGSVALYGHMIKDSVQAYVKVGEEVAAGQILGLMGASGTIITSLPDCNNDVPAGTHLHFEARNYPGGVMEPLGDPQNKNIQNGQILTSNTTALDPKNVYSQFHLRKYPYILRLEKVYSVTPLRAVSGSSVRFELKGESFSERSTLRLPFCSTQSFQFVDEQTAAIDCQVSGSGLKEGTFPNADQPEGILKYQVELSSESIGSPSISEVNFITAKPGEWMEFHVRGKNLAGNLAVDVSSRNFSDDEGHCEGSFSFLSPGSIKYRCQLPLNLGPVQQRNDQPFTVTVSQDGQVLGSKSFDINYGISAVDLLPRTALYYTPTRFTISGKNVHRTTVFYIEGCDKKDLNILSQKYDELVLECFIQPKPGTDLATINGKTFSHVFLFKTQSRYNEKGENVFDDEEDRSHVVVSGFIDVTYDKAERIEAISPAEAIIGKPTVFTVTGKNLPYGDEDPKLYSVWLEHCSAGNKKLEVIPDSYTPYGFDFQCVPAFSTSLKSGSSDFEITKVLERCDSILEQNWTEVEKNQALEKCYESDNRAVKQSMWGYFDQFFAALSPRKLHVKKAEDQNKVLVSEQSVRFVSALYDFIQHEEAFQFQYEREDGDYVINGPAVVNKVLAGEITRKNRHQTITVLGENLPRSLELISEECAQIAITYGSSENFEFVCLLKKVPIQEIRIIDREKQSELSRTYTDLIEVYEAKAFKDEDAAMLHLTGVNLSPNLRMESSTCLNFRPGREPSSTEMVYSCDLSVGLFTSSENVDLRVTSADGILLFDGVVKIQDQLPLLVKDTPSFPTPSSAPPPTEPDSTEPEVSVRLANEPLFESPLITLVCEASDDDAFFLGECRMSSDFIREAFVNASYDKQVRLAVMEGSFDTRLGKAVDDFAADKLLGLKLNPASGNGLIILDIDDQSLLMNGEVKAIGFDASEVLGFPFAFDLYDYSGQLIVTYPYFDVNKTREKSKIVFGIGQVPGEHITLFKKESDELKKKIEENMRAINAGLNKKKIEIGAKLIGSIENSTLKKLARTSYIKVLKALEIVPEAVGFYDNFDFIAKGKLKSEPFRPPSWPEESSWGVEANLATVDIDFIAKEGKLKLKGDALNSLSILNNDILKADRGLINLGITVALKEDDGRIDLDQVEVRLPGDFASAKADAHVVHLFKPSDLSISGNIESHIGIGPFQLAQAGAGFLYDPNLEYMIGSQKTLGLLQLESQMKMVALLLSGKAVFTLPERQELVMDIGGSLDLDFLGFNQRLTDILGRGRISSQRMGGCFNSETAEVVIKIPYYAKLPMLAITSEDTITIQGGFSANAQINFDEDDTQLGYFAMSGQAIDDSRIGFRYDAEKNWFSSFSVYEDVCHDVPEKSFLENVLPRMKQHESSQLASSF
ncbi:MAG: M23 family metallopeptidase [Candidatus Altimarinota bacterium]